MLAANSEVAFPALNCIANLAAGKDRDTLIMIKFGLMDLLDRVYPTS